MAERGHALKQDINKLAWEETDFPIICSNCLGDNPYIRMLKDRFGRECKVCSRPFTTFKWKPGTHSRPKSTEICQTCGKLKNICQACFKDLDFHMGMSTRDKFLGDAKIEIPEHSANRDYWAEQANRHIDRLILPYDKPLPMLEDILKEPRLVDVNMQLNDGRVELANQVAFAEIDEENLQDLMIKDEFKPTGILGPDDPKICSLYISHMTPEIKEKDLKQAFLKFGSINSIKIMEHGQSCFVNYSKRKYAEAAVNALYGNLQVKDVELKVQWARGASKKIPIKTLIQSIQTDGSRKAPPPQLPPKHVQQDEVQENKLLMDLLNSQTTYPSQDPYQKGGLKYQDL